MQYSLSDPMDVLDDRTWADSGMHRTMRRTSGERDRPRPPKSFRILGLVTPISCVEKKRSSLVHRIFYDVASDDRKTKQHLRQIK